MEAWSGASVTVPRKERTVSSRIAWGRQYPAFVVALAGVTLAVSIAMALSVSPPKEEGRTLRAAGDAAGQETAIRWISGLGSGLIMRSDVSRRLAVHDAALAESVAGVWAELGAIRADPTQLATSVSWLRGLVAGYIVPSDLVRLRVSQPEVAGHLTAAWRHLRAVDD
jgi:hypothetical protein